MMVENVDETVSFYRDVLGFDLVMIVPEQAPFTWALMKRDDVEVMFQTRASLTEEVPFFKPFFKERPLGGAPAFYIDVDGVESLYERVCPQVTVVKDLHTTLYGTREFAMRDCNGFLLTFAEGGA